MALDRGSGVTQKLDTGTGGSQPSAQSDAPDSSGGGGSYGGGGSSGGGGGGSAASSEQKKTQAQLTNTGKNYAKRAGELGKITQKRADDLNDIANKRQADMDKNAQAQLANINQSMQANNAALTENRRNIMQNVQWQPNQQKQQSTLMALRNRMGNAAYGSSIQDLAEGMQRVDDMNDVELINTWKQNENNAYSNWYQANESLVNDYNDQIASINEQKSQFAADYADQMSKLRADFSDEMSKLYSQYWSTMSNINPELATAANLKKAAKNAAGTSKTGKKSTLAKNTQKAVNQLLKQSKGKAVKVTGTKAQKAAAKIINKAVKDKSNKGNAKLVAKAAKKAAKAGVSKANAKNKVSVGKGTDKYSLPNVNLSKSITTGSLNPTSPGLTKMLVAKESASATNPTTSSYIRPDAGRATGGMVDTSRAANKGFSDNLAAFRRV